MKKTMACALAALMWAPLAATVALAAEAVPDAGLKAETEGRWQEAISVYQGVLDKEPGRVDLWQRIADIQVKLGNKQGAVAALERAARQAPERADLWFRLSQAQAAADAAKPALASVDQAVKLDPKNLEYLRARATLANWNQDFDAALDSYARVLAQAPNDPEATLGSARTSHWKGKDDAAAGFYRSYLAMRPDDATPALEAIEVEGSRGNAAGVKTMSEAYRKRFGENLEFWLRMADIYGLSGDDKASAEALEQAARLAPKDAKLYGRLAETYPEVGDAGKALAAIEKALELDPNNVEYLRTRADLAAWNGDYAKAMDSYRRIAQLLPDDAGALLGLARVNVWLGHPTEAARHYKAYLARFPQVQVVWLEYVEVITEIGDYALAMEVLEQYRQRFGETEGYKKRKARALAWADRPTPALGLVAELAPALPKDYDLAYTRTVALAAAHRPREALASLDEVTRLEPNSKETQDLQAIIRTPLRSYVTAGFGYRNESTDVTIRNYGVNGAYVLSPETRLLAAADVFDLHAPLDSGFATADGAEDARYTRTWVGASHLISPKVSVDALVGNGSADHGGGNHFVYRVGADFQPKDNLGLRLQREEDIFAVSPRAVSLGIMRRANELTATWAPDLRYTVEGLATTADLSDGNRYWETELAPRRAFVRTEHFNLDLGVSGRWFGYNQALDNGYYSPTMYRRYALTAFGYWKINDNNGVSAALSVGPYKDSTMDGFRIGQDLTLEGFFGIYKDWYLNPRLSWSHNAGAETGAFRSKQFEVWLTRRF